MKDGAQWFTVDKAGLAAVATRRGVAPLILEPIQNAWDEEGVSRVALTLSPVEGRRAQVQLRVKDDSPDGFRDLADAYTLYKQSYKIGNPEQRGRFNCGEKFLLSVASEASIISTTGSISFGPDGRKLGRKKTETGSILTATLKMRRTELDDALVLLRSMIPPQGIKTVINGEVLEQRKPMAEGVRTLQTEIKGDEGGFRLTRRKTSISIYEVLEGETPHLYEMGIPVDKLECPWHIDIAQKVPLSIDRSSVRQGFRFEVERYVAEIMAEDISPEEAQGGWIGTALESMEDADAIKAVMLARVGKAVTFNPLSPESNKRATDAGYAVIHGRQFSKAAWKSIRSADALVPSSDKFDDGRVKTSPNGIPKIPESQWTPAMQRLSSYTKDFAKYACGVTPTVEFWRDSGLGFAGLCGGGKIGFNVAKVKITDQFIVDQLLIHECAHLKVGDHLTSAFYNECCRIGARLRTLEATL
jgi:hypothetical protein